MLSLSRIEHAFDAIEHVLVHTAIKLSPWLVDLLPAYLTYRNLSEVLRFPLWISASSGLAVELVGLACAAVALRFRRYNITRRKLDPPAPETLAWALTGLYFASSLIICLLGTFTGLALYAILTFPLLGAVGTLVHAMEQDHRSRLASIEEEKAEAREERESKRREKALAKEQAPTQDLAQALPQPSTREQVLAFYLRNPLASQQEAADAVGVSRQAIGQHLQALSKQGIIERNGHGVKILEVAA
jgi:biotin operon repressor